MGFHSIGTDGQREIFDLAGSFQFNIDITKPSSTRDCYDSPTILLNNLNWILRLCFSDWNVKLELKAVPNFYTPDWRCEADTRIKLYSHSANIADREMLNGDNLIYSNMNSSYVIDNFMQKATFVSAYLEDNKATFEVELSTLPLDTRPPKPTPEIVRTYGKIYIKLNNFSTFRETASPTTIVQGVRWTIRLEKNNHQLYAHLLADPNDLDTNSSYKVFGVFKLLSFDTSKQNAEGVFTQDFGQYITTHSVTQLLLDSTHQTYVQNDSVNIVVEFKVFKSEILSNLNDLLKQKNAHTHQYYKQ